MLPTIFLAGAIGCSLFLILDVISRIIDDREIQVVEIALLVIFVSAAWAIFFGLKNHWL